MISNYLKVSRRYLWNTRLYTMLNIIGLAVGISACWVVHRLVSYEFSFDQHHANKDHMYRIVTRYREDGSKIGIVGVAGVPLPLSTTVRGQVPGVDQVVMLRGQWTQAIYAQREHGTPERFNEIKNVVATDAGYFGFIPYQWLAGSAERALAQPRQVVLTRSRAERYFPGLTPERILGMTLTYFDTLTVQVTGIVADPVLPTSLEAREFLSISTLPNTAGQDDAWDNINADDQVFIRLLPTARINQVEEQINQIVARHSDEVKPINGVRARWHLLQSITDIHFALDYPDGSPRAKKEVLYGLVGLAAFILSLACINYVNLATAQIRGRAREIGVRKALGSQRRTLMAQFLIEALLVTALGFGFAVVLSLAFFKYFGDLLPQGIETYTNWPLTVGFACVLVLGVSVLAGLYPAWIATHFRPITVLRGQFNNLAGAGGKKFSLRVGLNVFQFAMAQVLLLCACILYQQLQFSLNKDMGFNHEAVILAQLPMENADAAVNLRKRSALRQVIAGLPGVSSVSLGNPPVNRSVTSNELTLKQTNREVKLALQFKFVDTNYVSLYNLPLLAGRNLQPSDTVREYVLNQTAVIKLGFPRPQDAIGQLLYNGTQALPIVGVVSDFQVASVRESIRPVALVAYKQYANNMSIKLNSLRPADWQKTLSAIGSLWKRFYAEEPFKYDFYDQTLAAFYEQERTTGRIVNLATFVAILISCLGLFGLSIHMAFQRTKEIGVRKVLGSSVASIVALLAIDFLKPVMIALLVAAPIAWYFMHQWLQDFAYRIEVQWWLFAITSALTLGIALLTVIFQSIKAASTNPVISLKSD